MEPNYQRQMKLSKPPFSAFLIYYFCLFPFYASAAVTGLDTFYGIWAGSSFSNAYNVVAGVQVDTVNRVGFNSGVYAELPLWSWLAIRPEFSLVQKGYADALGAKVRLDYVELPIMVTPKIRFRGGSVYFPFGPTYGILLKKDTVDASGNVSKIPDDQISNNELTLQGGIGLEINFNYRWGIFFQGKYSYGLTNVYRTEFVGATTGYQSRSFYGMVGFFFTDPDEIDPNEGRAREYMERRSERWSK